LCGYARIGGWAVGIVANQKKHVQTLAPGSDQKRIEFGGVIYTESAEKAARFILDCNQNRIPLVFLHDVNGFMVGKDAELNGIIDPAQTRDALIWALEAAALNPNVPEFKTGVLQT